MKVLKNFSNAARGKELIQSGGYDPLIKSGVLTKCRLINDVIIKRRLIKNGVLMTYKLNVHKVSRSSR